MHIASGDCLSFEVIPRRLEDRGGGLARVNGRVRLVEGLAMPREEDEFKLSYYNSMTTWIDLDRLLDAFGLTRDEILADDEERISGAIHGLGDEAADLHHPQGGEQALGARPGGRVPGGAVRETVERHERAARHRQRLRGGAAAARPAAQGSGPTRRLAARRLGRRTSRGCASGSEAGRVAPGRCSITK